MPRGQSNSSSSSSSKQRHATFSVADHGKGSHDGDDEPPFPYHLPQLSAHGTSMVHAVSQLRSTFSVSVLSVAPPQVMSDG